MLKILNQQKGFKLDFKQQKKELPPLQRKCLDLIMETSNFLVICSKQKESEKIQSEIATIGALIRSIGETLKEIKNEELVRIHLKALYDFVNKIEFETVPKVLLKDFLVYRKKLIERIGR